MAAADAVLRALGHCPAYTATPLVGIDKLASTLGIRKMSVKDETDRMGLGSFKALGGAYAVFDYLLNKSPHSQHASSDTLIKSLSDAAAGSVARAPGTTGYPSPPAPDCSALNALCFSQRPFRKRLQKDCANLAPPLSAAARVTMIAWPARLKRRRKITGS
jgi:hypothetical protein